MHKTLNLAPMALVVTLVLTACGGGPDGTGAAGDRSTTEARATGPGTGARSGNDTGAGHGAVEGAQEMAEPQSHLVSIDAEGAVGMTNLLDGTRSEPGRISPPTSVTSDGRYLFATTDAGVEIVDSGVWTWDHADHFHYYRSSPRLLGVVRGDGEAVVSTSGNATTGSTGVLFPDSGRAVLLSNAALSRGEIDEVFRIQVEPHDGVVVPFGDGALITAPAGPDGAAQVRFHNAAGAVVDGVTAPCPEARGAITTRIGAVIGCADGAVLATGDDGDGADNDNNGADNDDGEPRLERIPYPDGVQAPAATEFRNRKGRPTVAATAGDAGFWLLDTRAREWRFVPTEQPLLQVSAVGDEGQHVVALDRSGRMHVYRGDSTGNGAHAEFAVTEPLLAGLSPAAVGDDSGPGAGEGRLARECGVTPSAAPQKCAGETLHGVTPGRGAHAGIELTVDRERAYVNDPASGLVHEIDYRGGARVARSLAPPTRPDFYAETGR